MPGFKESMKSIFNKKETNRETGYQALEGLEPFTDADAPISRAQHLSRLKDEAAHLNELRRKLGELMPKDDDKILRRKPTLANEQEITAAVTNAYKSTRATGASLRLALEKQLAFKLLSKDERTALREIYEEARASTQGTANELTMAKIMHAHCKYRRLYLSATEATGGKALRELEAQTAGYLEQAPQASMEAMRRDDYRRQAHGFDSNRDDPLKAWRTVRDEARRMEEIAGPSTRPEVSVSGNASDLKGKSDKKGEASSDEEDITLPSGIVIKSRNPYRQALEESRAQAAASQRPRQAEASSSRLTTDAQEAVRSGLKLK